MKKRNSDEPLEPINYGLSSRTNLFRRQNTIVLLIERKSRIIMKDGKNLLTKIRKIRETEPQSEVIIETTAPLCSKTKKLFHENGIKLVELTQKINK